MMIMVNCHQFELKLCWDVITDKTLHVQKQFTHLYCLLVGVNLVSLSFIKKQCDVLIAHDSIFLNKGMKKKNQRPKKSEYNKQCGKWTTSSGSQNFREQAKIFFIES